MEDSEGHAATGEEVVVVSEEVEEDKVEGVETVQRKRKYLRKILMLTWRSTMLKQCKKINEIPNCCCFAYTCCLAVTILRIYALTDDYTALLYYF